jgi:hypothetical protein
MKTTWATKTVLAACLGTTLVSAARAQNLTTPYESRRVLIPFYASDSHGGTYQPLLSATTNDTGAFDYSFTASTPDSFFYVSAGCTASQDSTITATATNLSITGQLEISSSGSAVNSQAGGGYASWAGLSEIVSGFTIDQPFTYSLQVTTSMLTNETETVPTAMVGISDDGDSGSGLPDILAYGSTVDTGGTAHVAPSASGTSTGVFSNGTYYLVARVHSNSGVDADHSPMSEHFLATFNLTVSYLPPQPPVITAFTADGTGAFNLAWNAPQPGNYRVVSSTNLLDWIESLPSASYPAGANTNLFPGSAVGGVFFRVQYLP